MELTQRMVVAGVDYARRATEDRFPDCWPFDIFVTELFGVMLGASLPPASGEQESQSEFVVLSQALETACHTPHASAAQDHLRKDLAPDRRLDHE